MGRPAQTDGLRIAIPIAVNREYPKSRQLQGIEFKLLAAPTAQQARFAFMGRFQDKEVIWDATLLTLAHYHHEQVPIAQAVERFPFLEIGTETETGRALRVALDIEQIDEPAILRTIIMIRQYKRLHEGRHEFGVARLFLPL